MRTQTPSTSPTFPVTPAPATGWCVPKADVSDAQLQANLNYACSQGIDCGPIQPGGACFDPNTVASHAAYAMNLYYQKFGRNPWNCYFSQSATLTSQNPSKFLLSKPILLALQKEKKSFWPLIFASMEKLCLYSSVMKPCHAASCHLLRERVNYCFSL